MNLCASLPFNLIRMPSPAVEPTEGIFFQVLPYLPYVYTVKDAPSPVDRKTCPQLFVSMYTMGRSPVGSVKRRGLAVDDSCLQVVGGCWSGSVGGGDHGEEGVFVDDGDAEGACLFELGGTHIFAGEDVIGFARD